MLAFLLLCVFVTTRGALYSAKYFKTRSSWHATPIDVCWPRFGNVTSSIQLRCRAKSKANDEEFHIVEAWHYDSEDCTGDTYYRDEFMPEQKGAYPFNCYETGEDGKLIRPEDKEADDYDPSYVIVKLTLANVFNTTETIQNSNNTNDTVTVNKTQCEPNHPYGPYRTYAAITNKCVLKWEGEGDEKKAFFYYLRCTDDSLHISKFEHSLNHSCDDNETLVEEYYQTTGCSDYLWEGQHWWQEVLVCTHPDGSRTSTAAKYIQLQRWNYYALLFAVFVWNMM